MNLNIYIILLFTPFVFLSCQIQEQEKVFELEGRSSLTINNQTGDSIRISIENWYLLPWESQNIDTIILSEDSLFISLIIQR